MGEQNNVAQTIVHLTYTKKSVYIPFVVFILTIVLMNVIPLFKNTKKYKKYSSKVIDYVTLPIVLIIFLGMFGMIFSYDHQKNGGYYAYSTVIISILILGNIFKSFLEIPTHITYSIYFILSASILSIFCELNSYRVNVIHLFMIATLFQIFSVAIHSQQHNNSSVDFNDFGLSLLFKNTKEVSSGTIQGNQSRYYRIDNRYFDIEINNENGQKIHCPYVWKQNRYVEQNVTNASHDTIVCVENPTENNIVVNVKNVKSSLTIDKSITLFDKKDIKYTNYTKLIEQVQSNDKVYAFDYDIFSFEERNAFELEKMNVPYVSQSSNNADKWYNLHIYPYQMVTIQSNDVSQFKILDEQFTKLSIPETLYAIDDNQLNITNNTTSPIVLISQNTFVVTTINGVSEVNVDDTEHFELNAKKAIYNSNLLNVLTFVFDEIINVLILVFIVKLVRFMSNVLRKQSFNSKWIVGGSSVIVLFTMLFNLVLNYGNSSIFEKLIQFNVYEDLFVKLLSNYINGHIYQHQPNYNHLMGEDNTSVIASYGIVVISLIVAIYTSVDYFHKDKD